MNTVNHNFRMQQQTVNRPAITGGGCMEPPPYSFPDGFCGTVPPGAPKRPEVEGGPQTLAQATEATAGLVSDRGFREMVREHKIELPDRKGSFALNITNVDWSDNHRYDNSSGGGNITDATIAVVDREAGTQDDPKVTLLPIIRGDNFSDETVDMSIDRIQVMVGNEKGESPKPIPLTEYIANIRDHLSNPESLPAGTKLLADRDTHVLTSAQGCFLPVPKGEGAKVDFIPTAYNYQSSEDDSACLTIVATAEGTSATIINNKRDRFANMTKGQPLFFNDNGQRALLQGGRISERPAELGGANGEAANGVANDGSNMAMIIQIPLKHENDFGFMGGGAMLEMASFGATRSFSMAPSTEDAYLTHGEAEGPFTEVDQNIERDTDLPIRVTFQFWKATDGAVGKADVGDIADKIQAVYGKGDFGGSLVVDRDESRPTAPQGKNKEPNGFWTDWADKAVKEGELPTEPVVVEPRIPFEPLK